MIIERKEIIRKKPTVEIFYKKVKEAKFVIKDKFQYEGTDWFTGKKFKITTENHEFVLKQQKVEMCKFYTPKYDVFDPETGITFQMNGTDIIDKHGLARALWGV